MTKRMHKFITSSMVAFTLVLALPGTSNSAEVIGDNEIAAYVGTGGLLLPTSFSGSAGNKVQVANCLGCVWAYTVFCLYDDEGLCQHSVSTCPVGQIKYRVWFGKSIGTAEVVGSVCWGSGRPPTRMDIEKRIDDLVINYIPALDVTLIPPGGTLTSIPVLGWTNQPQKFQPPAFSLGGRSVEITAIPKWRWVWGDGDIEWKSVPGVAYPQIQIRHLYRATGTYVVEVTAVWQASYSVQGIGTFNVGGDLLTQTDSIAIDVTNAKSRLMKRT